MAPRQRRVRRRGGRLAALVVPFPAEAEGRHEMGARVPDPGAAVRLPAAWALAHGVGAQHRGNGGTPLFDHLSHAPLQRALRSVDPLTALSPLWRLRPL